jgi:4a-hydroxytetrahydrobiopterin dehydratase
MQIQPAEALGSRKCVPCEGGVESCSLNFAIEQAGLLVGWQVVSEGKWIRRSVRFKNFVRTIEAVNKIAELAETEAHHPDLHVTGYRILTIELTTHAIGGLSENDFILAAKIDSLLASSFPDAKNHE